MEIFKILGLVSINNKEANKSLDEVNKKAENVSKELEKKFESIGKGFSKAGETMSKIGSKITKTVTVPLIGISAAAGKTAIDFVKLKESSMGVFEKMLGGSEAAEEMYQSLLKVAKASTYSQEAFLTAGKTLVGMGTSAQDTTKYLQAITDAVAGFGGSSADIESLASVFGKVSAKGKVLTDDLNMLSERGVNGLQILAAHYGKTTDEMQEMVSKGMIPAKEGLDILCDGMENGYTYAGQFHQGLSGMAQQLKGGTLTGALDGLKSSFRNFSVELVGAFDNKQYMIDFVNAFGTALGHLPKLLSGITDSIAPALQKVSRLLNKFNEFAQTKEGQESLKKIGDLILKLAVAGPIITILGKLTSKFSGVFTIISKLHGAGGLPNLIARFSKLLPILGSVIGPIVIIIGVLALLTHALGGPKKALDKLKQAFSFCKDVIQGFLDKINFGDKLDAIKKKIQPLSEKLKGLKDLFKVLVVICGATLVPAITLLSGLFGGILNAIQQVIDCIGYLIDLLSGLGEFIVGIFTLDGEKIVGGLKKVFGSVVGIIISPFKIAWTFISGFFEGIGSFFGSLLEKLGIIQAIDNIKSAIVNWWNGILDWLSGAWDGICNVVSIGFQIIANLIDAAFQIITLPFRFIWENCKEYIFNVWEWIKEKVSSGINAVKNIIDTVQSAITTAVQVAWEWIKEKIIIPISEAFNRVKEIIDNIKSTVSEKFNAVKDNVSEIWNSIKEKVNDVINNIKSTVSNVFDSIKTKATDIWNGIKTAIETPINRAKDIVKNAIDKIKGFFNFEFKWPKLKMPHFGIKPSGWKIGDLLKGSVPKLSIDWYAKAMDSGMILDDPTIFGMNKDGQLMGAGEKGSETIVGTNSLMNMIKQSVNNQNHLLEARIDTLIEILLQYLPILVERKLCLDSGAIVGELTPLFDKALGDLSDKKGRGR